MKTFAFINSFGEVQYTSTAGGLNQFEEGKTYNGLTALNITGKSDAFLVENYWKDGEWIPRGPRPGPYYEWVRETWVLNKERLLKELKELRNARLSASDWTQLPDVSTGVEWLTYRQKLRDLPSQCVDITHLDEVEWPTPPS